MAYLKRLRTVCDVGGCSRDATSEVFNDFNASCGRYCNHHAKAKVTQMNKAKAEQQRNIRVKVTP